MELLQQISDWFDTFVDCLSMPMSGPACRSLWETVMYASATLGLVLTLGAGWKIAATWREQNTAWREEEERQRLAEEHIERKRQFIEDRDIAAEVTDPKLAETIRRELERQRRRKLRKPDGDEE